MGNYSYVAVRQLVMAQKHTIKSVTFISLNIYETKCLSHILHQKEVLTLISIILAAGSGTRMRPLSNYIPKVLLPVRGKPVLSYLFKNMEKLPVKKHFIIASQHLETIERYIDSVSLSNVEVVRALGWETGGDLSLSLELIGLTDDALVMNGDIVTDIDYADIWNIHKKHRDGATLSVFSISDPESAKRFGQIKLEEDGRISSFNEKNPLLTSTEILVNTGFYIFDRKLIENRREYFVPRKFKLENELFPRLCKENKLFGVINKVKYWWDVGTMESYLKTEEFLINNSGVVPP